MRRTIALVALACASALVVSLAAGAAPRATPGVTSSEIVLGGSAPFSGEASAAGAVARGANAYFQYVNAHGGVFKRKITYKVLDDGYVPATTVQNARQLVQQDQVFAIFNTVGTENNLAIRSFLNQLGVPQLFVAAGATAFGKDAGKYPWTIGYIPTYGGEGKLYGQHIHKTKPTAKVAVLYQDDDYGNDLVNGLKKGLGKQASKIVKVGYDPTSSDVQSQIAQLKASKATVLCIFAFGKFSIQSYTYLNKLGWKPQVYVNDVSSAASLMVLNPPKVAEGSISIVFAKDPGSPAWKNDKGIKLYNQVMKRYYPEGLRNSFAAAGAAAGFTMVDTLKKAGKNLTRDSVMRAATHLTERNNPFILPGAVVKTTPGSRYPVGLVKLQRWHKGHWVMFGKLVSAKP
jgi:branched-chain amino acid transport system substrate-binding protein